MDPRAQHLRARRHGRRPLRGRLRLAQRLRIRGQSPISKTRNPGPGPIFTLGHSNRALEDFIGLLRAHGVTRLVDVRTVPRSRANPQFNKDSLPRSLRPAGIGYAHMPGLGGLRRAAKDSINAGWRNASFRGYADYMQTPEFAHNLDKLLEATQGERVALMCAEALPWRCHRSLIADALLVRGIPVEDIMTPTRRQAHRLTPFARVRGTRVTYPAVEGEGSAKSGADR